MWEGYHNWLEQEFGQGQGIVWDNSWYGFPYLSARQFPLMKVIHSHHGMSNWAAGTPQGMQYIKPPVPFPRMLAVSSHHANHISSNFGIPVRYVHNGIDLPDYKLEDCAPADYLLSLNRITPEKGIHNNIDVALQTGWKMKIVGDDIHPPNQDYINDIQNRCAQSNGQIEYYGRVDNDTKWDLLKHCRALIACTDNQRFLEAFGLYAVEANACYKPVIATTNGGLYDIIVHDKDNGWQNGFLAPNTAGVVDAIRSGILETLKPDVCRAHATRFTVDKMVDSYTSLFEKVLRDDADSRW
jgi:glycosyltransferase involved in cell wall biosynthesis